MTELEWEAIYTELMGYHAHMSSSGETEVLIRKAYERGFRAGQKAKKKVKEEKSDLQKAEEKEHMHLESKRGGAYGRRDLKAKKGSCRRA